MYKAEIQGIDEIETHEECILIHTQLAGAVLCTSCIMISMGCPVELYIVKSKVKGDLVVRVGHFPPTNIALQMILYLID